MKSREHIVNTIIMIMEENEDLKLSDAKKRYADGYQNEFDENDLESITLDDLTDELIKRENPWYVSQEELDAAAAVDDKDDYVAPKYSRDFIANSGKDDYVPGQE